MSPLRRIWLALRVGAAETSPEAEDPRLRGRTYAIPFDRVWTEALALADGGLTRWRVLEADDYEGVIGAEAVAALFGFASDITIHIVLDRNAQTRVDAKAANQTGRADLGASARHLARFFRSLDRAVGAGSRPKRPATR